MLSGAATLVWINRDLEAVRRLLLHRIDGLCWEGRGNGCSSCSLPQPLCFRKLVTLIHTPCSLLASHGGRRGSRRGSERVLGWKPPKTNVCQSHPSMVLQSWAANTGARRCRSANLSSSLGSELNLSLAVEIQDIDCTQDFWG